MRSARQFFAGWLGYKTISEYENTPYDCHYPWVKIVRTHAEMISVLEHALNEGYSAGRAEVNNLHARIAQLENEKINLQSQGLTISQLNSEIANLRTSLQQSSSQAITQNARVSQLTAENVSLRSNVQQISQQASVKSTSDSAQITKLLSEAAEMKAKLQKFEVEIQRQKNSEQKKMEEFIILQNQLAESNAKLAARDVLITNLQGEIEKFKNESKLSDVKANIGLFRQIIATPSNESVSAQQRQVIMMSNTQ